MLELKINGQPLHASAGQSILSVLRGTSHMVPALCDDPRLKPIGGCRLCLVEIAGQSRPCTACTTEAHAGMEILTHTPQLEAVRRTQLRLLAQNYPAETDPGTGQNAFVRLIHDYGVTEELGSTMRPQEEDDSHPCLHVDMSRCILCFRCVRICEEVAGRFVWKAWNRGSETQIRPADGTTLRESDCVSCGACVDTCPSGALRDKSTLTKSVPTEHTHSVCAYCGTGCEIDVRTRDDLIHSVLPVIDAPVNKGHLCAKGRYGWEYVDASDRITSPMIRRGQNWEPVSWEHALDFVASALRESIRRFGPNAVGVLGSARATNEENYLAQKFTRIVLGSHNIDCCARVCHAPTAAGMKLMLGTGAATNSFADIEQARAIIVFGANPRENHPIVGDRIVQAVRHGAKLIVIDPRRIELADHADLYLQLRPGTNVPLLNAMAQVIIDEQLYDEEVPKHVENWDEYCRTVADYSPEAIATICEIDAKLIRATARFLAAHSPAMFFHGLGLTEHVQGTDGVICFVNLALLTGSIGKPGAGVNPLRGQNNVQGAAHMGCDPNLLTGSQPLAKERGRFERIWNARLPDSSGLNLLQMCDAAERGEFKALWVMGYDIALTNPNAESTLAALSKLDLLIIQDVFLTETARHSGSVFLPACTSFEKDGTFMNSERRIQRVRQAIPPRGASQPDWKIICQIAKVMGHEEQFSYQSAEEIWNEVRMVWPDGAGISYRRLENGGLQWPCPDETHPGTAILHTNMLREDTRFHLRPIIYRPTTEEVTDEYPFLLNTGRALYQFNAGTMSGRSSASQLQPMDRLQINAEDARCLGITEHQQVRIRSRYGETLIRAQITERIRRGEAFATFQTPELFLNRLTSRNRDSVVLTPEYKITAVHIEPIGSNPKS